VSKSEFRALLAVAVAAVVIRLAVSAAFKGHSYVAAEPVKPETEATYLKRGEIWLGDSEQYLLLGDGIRHRLSYSWSEEQSGEGERGNGKVEAGIPNTFRTPGYPLLLALLNNNVAAIVVVQALLAGLTVFLVGLVGLRLFNLRVGLLGAALLALDIPSIFSSGMVMSEVLFTFSVVLAAAFVWGFGSRKPQAASCRPLLDGLVLGFAVLVRPVALLAFVPFGVAQVARRNWRGLAVMLAAFSLLPGIWMARNYYHYRRFSLTSNGGYNLLYANAAAVQGDEEHVSWDSARVELAHDFTAKLATDNPLVLSDAMTRKATSIILHDPLRYAWICLRGMPKVIAGIKSDDLVLRMSAAVVSGPQGSVLLNRGYGSSGVRLAIWLLAGFELLTAVGGFLLALISLGFRRWRAEKLMLVVIGLYFVVVALPFTDGRFRVPAMPFLYLAAATVLAGRNRRTESESRN
jgi:4-amino-4-deoxy-L-arabinose transferase-like glycosyltransferase